MTTADATTDAPADTPRTPKPTDVVIPGTTPPAAAQQPVDQPGDDLGREGGQPRHLAELAEERKRRQAVEADLQTLADRLKQYEDRDKTDLERAQQAAEEAKRDADAAKAELLRLRVAADLGLPGDLVEFLTGDDEATLRQRGEKLLAATAGDGTRRPPAPDPTQGAQASAAGPDQLTRADLARMTPTEIEAARVAGRFADLLAGT